MEEARVYKIATVADFLNVPPGSLDECLRDFHVALSRLRDGVPEAVLGAMAGKNGEIVFRWEDRGKRVVDFGEGTPVPECMRAILP